MNLNGVRSAEMNKDNGYCYLGELKEGADNG